MDRSASDDNSECAPDDAFSIICGDLGLGENSRSSASLRYELEILADYDSFRKLEERVHKPLAAVGKRCSEDLARLDINSQSSVFQENGISNLNKEKTSGSQRKVDHDKLTHSKTPNHNLDSDQNSRDDEEHFPTYADVPYGTSLRQQKKLFEQNLGSIIKRNTCVSEDDSASIEEGEGKTLTSEEIDKRLLSALGEVEELKQDLEVCRQRLDAKYNAIAILRKQAEEVNHEHITSELKARETSLKLAETGDGGSLGVAECGLILGETPRETLQRKYWRVCQENALLTAQLEARSEELRRANCHKIFLRRERDELLALLDIKERSKYEKCHSRSTEEEFSQYSTTELAVLGACRCRGADETDPCGCSYAAANLTREICRLGEDTKLLLQRRDEAYKTVDAYRLAFEEQLAKSRAMSQQLATLATSTSRVVKAKAAVKWLLSVLADEDYPPVKLQGTEGSNHLHNKESLEALTLPDLVMLLTDMLHEKKEALIHQKLAGQALAARLQETERKLQALAEADGNVLYS